MHDESRTLVPFETVPYLKKTFLTTKRKILHHMFLSSTPENTKEQSNHSNRKTNVQLKSNPAITLTISAYVFINSRAKLEATEKILVCHLTAFLACFCLLVCRYLKEGE